MRILILILLVFHNFSFSQKTCESSEDPIEDFNTITKCNIQTSKKKGQKETRQISVQISAPKQRFLKKRTVAQGANTLNSSGLSKVENNNSIVNSLDLKKNNSSVLDVAKLSNQLSAEELKKAVKFNDLVVIPTFEGCKLAKKNEKLNCFNKEMIQHIQHHFRYPEEAVINKIEGNVWVRFVIGKDGTISNIKTLGPKGADILNKEAVRVVSMLPKLLPGKIDGEKVSVKYGFPINFSLNNE